jgi:hypothetical protein
MRVQVLMVVPPCLSGFSERNSVRKVVWFTDLIANSYEKQDGKCTYNVTLGPAPAPMLQWKGHMDYIFWVCICSLRYSACNALAPYYISICLAPEHFSTLCHQRHDFWQKVTVHKVRVLFFSTSSVWNISHSKKKWARCYHKCILVFT